MMPGAKVWPFLWFPPKKVTKFCLSFSCLLGMTVLRNAGTRIVIWISFLGLATGFCDLEIYIVK